MRVAVLTCARGGRHGVQRPSVSTASTDSPHALHTAPYVLYVLYGLGVLGVLLVLSALTAVRADQRRQLFGHRRSPEARRLCADPRRRLVGGTPPYPYNRARAHSATASLRVSCIGASALVESLGC